MRARRTCSALIRCTSLTACLSTTQKACSSCDGTGRWTKRANELDGYQNKACVGYKIMENNDDARWAWTSNVQLISKVYLKKHSSEDWHTLNAKDRKMVSTAVTKKI